MPTPHKSRSIPVTEDVADRPVSWSPLDGSNTDLPRPENHTIQSERPQGRTVRTPDYIQDSVEAMLQCRLDAAERAGDADLARYYAQRLTEESPIPGWPF